MKIVDKLSVFSTLCLVVLSAQNAHAATVYQWTDEEGVTHYSDAPPSRELNTYAREIEFESFTDRDNTEEIQTMNELSDSLAERRKLIEDERLVRKSMALEEKRLELEFENAQLENRNDRSYYLPYSYLYGHPHNRFQQGHRHNRFQDGLIQEPRPERPERPVAKVSVGGAPWDRRIPAKIGIGR